MGWCSGTEIMDAAVKAADAIMEHVLKRVSEEGADASDVLIYERDEILRPFVRTIARKLQEGDWDCIDEAEAFDRFPQEMYDHDDQEHAAWLRDRIRDSDELHEFEKWTAALRAHTDKMKAGNA